MLGVVLLALLVVLLVLVVLHNFRRWFTAPQQFHIAGVLRRAPPEIDGVLPFLGCLPQIMVQGGLEPFLLHLKQRYGDVVTLNLLGIRITMLFSQHGLTQFFTLDEDKFNFAEGARMFLSPMMGKRIVDAAIPVAPLILNSARRALNSGALRSQFQLIDESLRRFLDEHWAGEQGRVELSDSLHECLTTSTCKLLFEMDSTEIGRLYTDLERSLGLLAVFLPWLPLPSNRTRWAARDRIIALIEQTIATRRREGSASSRYSDLLQILTDTKLRSGEPLPPELIPFGIINVLLAATTSTPVVDTWTIVFLLQNSSLMAEIVAEQDRVADAIRAAGRSSPDLDDLRDMEKLHCCLKETIRFVSATLLQRRVMQPVPFDDRYCIPPQHYVCVSPRLVHFDSTVYSAPQLYDPFRFAAGRDEGRGQEYFLGFGRGAHQCAGERIAYLQSKLLLHYLLTRYELQFAPECAASASRLRPNANQPLALLKPTQPVLIRYRRRQEKKQ